MTADEGKAELEELLRNRKWRLSFNAVILSVLLPTIFFVISILLRRRAQPRHHRHQRTKGINADEDVNHGLSTRDVSDRDVSGQGKRTESHAVRRDESTKKTESSVREEDADIIAAAMAPAVASFSIPTSSPEVVENVAEGRESSERRERIVEEVGGEDTERDRVKEPVQVVECGDSETEAEATLEEKEIDGTEPSRKQQVSEIGTRENGAETGAEDRAAELTAEGKSTGDEKTDKNIENDENVAGGVVGADTDTIIKDERTIKEQEVEDGGEGREVAERGTEKEQQDEGDREVEEKADNVKAVEESEERGLDEKLNLERALEEKKKGNDSYAQKMFDDALEHYNKSVDLMPRENPTEAAVVFNNMAAVYLVTQQFEHAYDCASSALELDPSLAKALLRRSKAQQNMDKVHEALADLKAAAELSPFIADAHKGDLYKLEKLSAEKAEKEKAEVIEKMKTFGNWALGKLGMSLDDFEAKQDPTTGSYSIAMKNKAAAAEPNSAP